MELTVVKQNILDGSRFRDLPFEARRAGLTAAVARLYSLKGMGGNAEAIAPEIALAVSELLKECAVTYSGLTMAEIRYALEAGVKGQLDECPTYLNTANMCRWLCEYKNSALRLEALQAVYNDPTAEASRQLTAGTTEARDREAMERFMGTALVEVQTTGSLEASQLRSGAYAALYDYLRKTGRLEKPSNDEILAAFEKVTKGMRPGPKFETVAEAVKSATAVSVNAVKRLILEDYLKTL